MCVFLQFFNSPVWRTTWHSPCGQLGAVYNAQCFLGGLSGLAVLGGGNGQTGGGKLGGGATALAVPGWRRP